MLWIPLAHDTFALFDLLLEAQESLKLVFHYLSRLFFTCLRQLNLLVQLNDTPSRLGGWASAIKLHNVMCYELIQLVIQT